MRKESSPKCRLRWCFFFERFTGQGRVVQAFEYSVCHLRRDILESSNHSMKGILKYSLEPRDGFE